MTLGTLIAFFLAAGLGLGVFVAGLRAKRLVFKLLLWFVALLLLAAGCRILVGIQ